MVINDNSMQLHEKKYTKNKKQKVKATSPWVERAPKFRMVD